VQQSDPSFSARASQPTDADSPTLGQNAALKDDPVARRPGPGWLAERRSAIEHCISNDLI
jgi:hypothetical protein